MDSTPEKSPVALREEKILEFWQKNKIFERSIGQDAPHGAAKGDYIFYDGPPFATGLPHFGHVLPTSIKDAIPRYRTMRGYNVRRRWGWDCHGLPVENLIEKELGLKARKDITDFGIGKFNEACRAAVTRYTKEWKEIVPRLGRWVDMENDYETMKSSYTESVWWAFKTLHDKGLIYEGFKAMQLCPRCETTLSNFEVNQGYKDITDISVYVKFEVVAGGNALAGASFLAWTTTPWTLPGNVALAVKTDIDYVVLEVANDKGTHKLIVAEERVPALVASKVLPADHTVLATLKGTELVGLSYRPVFDYYTKAGVLPTKEEAKKVNAWKVYGADFVTTTDGTGIVHIASAFGSDDMELGKVNNLPFIQHVTTDGRFKKEVTDFAGQLVKPKDDHQKGDIEIIKYVAATHTETSPSTHSGTHSPALFAKEKIVHSYPHCWRCDTPLLNYASSSWFVKVPDVKDKLVDENKKVNWVPSEVGEGRFGNWLLGARDWAISRSRFWGAPLPVWRVLDEHGEPDHTKEPIVIGSLADLKKYSKARNQFYVIRHGEAENNVKGVISSKATVPHHLSEKGKTQVAEGAAWLKDKQIDLIIASPFVRTRETAELVAKGLGLSTTDIVFDERLVELNAGIHDGADFKTFISYFTFEKRFDIRPEGGENYADIKKRVGDFIYDTDKKYEGKRILIVTHDSPAYLLTAVVNGLDRKETLAIRGTTDHFFANAEPRKLDFVPLPHNAEYELDLHRPYIDDVALALPAGEKLERIPEVFDCWFESGSMPFAEAHYPFEKSDEFQPNKGLFKHTKGYPADFIAEGQDQTRGWFYSMLVLGVALFGHTPYKNVVVNGLVLAEDGQKMSKSKKNYPDLMLTVNKFGSDALRYYLLSSPLVRAQEFCFSEKGVDEVVKKHIGRLNNVLTFYKMYAQADATVQMGSGKKGAPQSTHVLDTWILARLNEITIEITRALDAYELDRGARPFAEFIDDLSTWYVRRGRDRFKAQDKDVLETTHYVLLQTAKLLAPFMPFLAEDIYLQIGGPEYTGKESVHLCEWPEAIHEEETGRGKTGAENGKAIIKHMKHVRAIASLGLEARSRAKINVRQPLAKLSVKSVVAEGSVGNSEPERLDDALLDLIREEVNVKEVVFDEKLGVPAELDTLLTPVLKEEGQVREITRAIQDLRKTRNFSVSDVLSLSVATGAEGGALIEKYKTELMKATGLKEISFTHSGVDANGTTKEQSSEDTLTLDGQTYIFSLKK